MNCVDVNVLLYAASPSSQEHHAAREVLEQARRGLPGLGVLSTVAASFLRIATDPRASTVPLSAEQGLQFLDAVLDAPNARVVNPGPAHWSTFRQLCLEYRPRRGDVTDCWLAAAAMEIDATWLSFDRGFARFSGLRWVDPTRI